MMLWASLPYAVWQLSYHFLISVRRRDKIAAGTPTSFTWLRRSFSNVWLGRVVISLPETLQEPAYMFIQYLYALITMVPCPLWFWSRWASGIFLSTMFAWSVWNGATYYIDVFGTRFQKELQALKKDVAKWQALADGQAGGPLLSPELDARPPPFPIPGGVNGVDEKVKDAIDNVMDPTREVSSREKEMLPGIDGGLETDDIPVREGKKDI
jgi:hypothetical protein